MSTNWNGYSLTQIWEIIKDEPEAIGHKQQEAWSRASALCHQHADQLRAAVKQLAESWVPTPGSAAEKFQAFGLDFADHIRRCGENAATNSAVIADITSQMTSAHNRIARLIQQRIQYLDADSNPFMEPAVPGLIAGASDPRMPPVGWADQLTQQAREIMSQTESTVVARANSAKVTAVPSLYQINDEGREQGSESVPSGGTSMLIAIPIAAPTTSTGFEDWPDGASSNDASSNDTGSNGAGSNGAVLAGGNDVVPSQSGYQPGGPTTDIGQSRAAVPAPILSPLPPGGMIDGRRPDGSPGGRPVGAAGGQVNANRPNAGHPMMAPMIPPSSSVRHAPGSGNSISASGRVGRREQDADSAWSVRGGGPALIEPSLDVDEHDPGPGVIGLDR
jgi:hypothetical protein